MGSMLKPLTASVARGSRTPIPLAETAVITHNGVECLAILFPVEAALSSPGRAAGVNPRTKVRGTTVTLMETGEEEGGFAKTVYVGDADMPGRGPGHIGLTGSVIWKPAKA